MALFGARDDFSDHTASAGFTKMSWDADGSASNGFYDGDDERRMLVAPRAPTMVGEDGSDMDVAVLYREHGSLAFEEDGHRGVTIEDVGQRFGKLPRGLLQPGGAGTKFGRDVRPLRLQQPGVAGGASTLRVRNRRLRAGVSNELVTFVEMSRESFYLLYQEMAGSLQLGQHDLFVPKDPQSAFAGAAPAGLGLQSSFASGAVDRIDAQEQTIGELADANRTRIIARAQAQKRTSGAKNFLSKEEIMDNFKEDHRAKGAVFKAVNDIRGLIGSMSGEDVSSLNSTDQWIIGLARETDTRTILVAVASLIWHETVYGSGMMTPNDIMYAAVANQADRQVRLLSDPAVVSRLVSQVRSSNLRGRG